jgi:hypothetical protein
MDAVTSALVDWENFLLADVVASAVPTFGRDPVGLGWIAIAMVTSFIRAVIDAWVLLVETNR